MQLNYERLLSHLHSNFAAIYLVHGDEPLLVQEACQAIRNKAIQQNYTEQIRFTVDAQFNWNNFANQYNNLSLFNERQLVELQLTANLTTQGNQLLQDYAQQINQDKVILITSPKLTNAQLQSSWCKAIDKYGIIVTIWPITPGQLPNWLQQRFKQSGLTITSDGLQLLADYCNGNLLAAQQLLEKVKLLATEQVIKLETIQQTINDGARFTVFDLTDACLQGDVKRALRILDKLAAENTDLVLIVWSLARELRALISYAEQQTTQTYARPAATNKNMALLAKVSLSAPVSLWYQLLMQVAEVDQIVKGASTGNAWQFLRTICLQFATRKQNLFI